MKRKITYLIEEEINTDYHYIEKGKIQYEPYKIDKQINIIYRPKKRIRMTKRQRDKDDEDYRNNIKTIKTNYRKENIQEITQKMTPQQKGQWFEQVTNQILKEGGMTTTPSSAGYYDRQKEKYIITGDGGIDISGQYKGKSFIVQCKCHKDPIPPTIVRQMVGLLLTRRDTIGIICAIEYTESSRREANNYEGRIILTDLNNIVTKIKEAISQMDDTKLKMKMTYQKASNIRITNKEVELTKVEYGEITFRYERNDQRDNPDNLKINDQQD